MPLKTLNAEEPFRILKVCRNLTVRYSVWPWTRFCAGGISVKGTVGAIDLYKYALYANANIVSMLIIILKLHKRITLFLETSTKVLRVKGHNTWSLLSWFRRIRETENGPKCKPWWFYIKRVLCIFLQLFSVSLKYLKRKSMSLINRI